MSCADNDIDSHGAVAFAELLTCNQTLSMLNLNCECIRVFKAAIINLTA